MPEGSSPIPIIRTKLHRPPVAGDVVPRPRLLERLEEGATRRLTLVCAPAGYCIPDVVKGSLGIGGAHRSGLTDKGGAVVGRAKRLIRAFLI